jgi:hypothetical protein
MALTKLTKTVGAMAAGCCVVVAGIAVNVGILGAGPDDAGNLSVGTHRASTTTVSPVRSRRRFVTHRNDSAPRVVLHVVPSQEAAVSAPTPTGKPLPFDGGGSPDTTATTSAPSTTPTTTTTTTTTTSPSGQVRTYKIATAGSVSTRWVDEDTLVVTARPTKGWSVRLYRDGATRVIARFSRQGHTVVWSARLVDHTLRVELRRP